MLKKQMFGLVLTSIFTLAGSLQAFQPVSDLSLTGGWRQDEIKNTVSSSFGCGEMKLEDLNTWQFGVRGQYAIPSFCGCEDYLNGLFVRGSAIWGWGDDGKAKFSSGNSGCSGDYSYYGSEDYSYGSSSVSFKTHDTKTYDYTIGLGWLYSIDCNWAIGPTVGYEWDKLSTKAKDHGSCSSYGSYSGSDYFSGSSESYGSGGNLFEYTSKWNGPWLGVELAYEDCEFHVNAGYEFHWAEHKSDFKSSCNGYGSEYGSANGFGRDSHKNHSRYGNVVYLDGWYDFCECWEVGLGFKYYSFETKSHNGNSGSGSYESGDSYYYYADSYSGSSNGNKGKSRWTAWDVTLDLGYRF